MRTSIKPCVLPLVTGVLAMVFMQSQTGWWLNAENRVLPTLLVLVAAAVLCGLDRDDSVRSRELTLWAGAMIGLTGWLFYTGPGTIWPVVLLVSSVMTGVAVLIGTGVAAGVFAIHRATAR
jgi:hypothetical protein